MQEPSRAAVAVAAAASRVCSAATTHPPHSAPSYDSSDRFHSMACAPCRSDSSAATAPASLRERARELGYAGKVITATRGVRYVMSSPAYASRRAAPSSCSASRFMAAAADTTVSLTLRAAAAARSVSRLKKDMRGLCVVRGYPQQERRRRAG